MSNHLKVGVCAVDVGSQNVCALVKNAAEAEAGTFELYEVPGLSVAAAAPVIRQVRDSAALLCGCSYERPEARVTLAALNENPSLVPVLVEDFPGTAGNFLHLPQMQELVQRGVYACTIIGDQNEALLRAGFKGVTTVGLPDHWTDSVWQMQQARLDRQAGKILKETNGVAMPVNEHDAVVYFSGLKDPPLELEILKELYAQASVGGKNLLIAFRAHPGEKRIIGEIEEKRRQGSALPADLETLKIVQEAIAERDGLVAQHPRVIVDCEPGQLHDRLTGAADVVLINPASTTQYPAMALQGGTMLLTTRSLVNDQEKKDRRSFANEAARMLIAEKDEDICASVEKLLDPRSPERQAMIQRQKGDQLTINPAEKKFGQNVLNAIRRWTRA